MVRPFPPFPSSPLPCSPCHQEHSLEHGGESRDPPAPAPAVADEAAETSAVCRLLRGQRGHVTAHSPLPAPSRPGQGTGGAQTLMESATGGGKAAPNHQREN